MSDSAFHFFAFILGVTLVVCALSIIADTIERMGAWRQMRRRAQWEQMKRLRELRTLKPQHDGRSSLAQFRNIHSKG